MRPFVKILISAIPAILVVNLTNAQLIGGALSLVATPSSPSPGQSFTVQASTPTIDKNTISFDWLVDGKARPDLSGAGQNLISLTAGAIGSATRVTVKTLGAEEEKTSSLNVRVADLALTWTAETYVPKWYKGKALPVRDSIVNIAAIPGFIIDGGRSDPARLIYKWSLDDEDNIVSGIGKQVFRIRTSDLPKSSHHIRAVVEDTDKLIRKESSLFITTLDPFIDIYSSTPLGGIEPRSSNFLLNSAKGLFDFLAEPFFFPITSKKNISYQWSVAGRETAGGAENPYALTIDTAGYPTDVLDVTVTVNPANSFIPSLSKTLNVIFKK